jgi:hypothetical protein
MSGWRSPNHTRWQLGLSYPLASIVFAIGHLQNYPFAAPVTRALHVLDVAAIAGALLAFVLGIRVWIRRKSTLTAVTFAYALFGVLASCSLLVSEFRDVYGFARHNSPLFFALLLQSLRRNEAKLAAPLALVLPRSIIPIASMTLRSIGRLLGI